MSLTPAAPACRFCRAPLQDTFVDLGSTPLCESYLNAGQLDEPEATYPLHVWVCRACLLVQLEAFTTPEAIFSEYAYFSSYSDSWVAHARSFATMAIDRFDLGSDDLVIEVGSNDGYLLQHFVARGVRALGIEPAANVGDAARARGVPTETVFFGNAVAADLVARGPRARVIVANNVLAQVPDLNDFVAGLATLLAPDGVVSIEVPHLAELVAQCQFDTIYHEHFSYFSLLTLERILAAHRLVVVDVETLTTHGGSLRVFARHRAVAGTVTSAVEAVRQRERAAGLDRVDGYAGFDGRVRALRQQLLDFLDGVRARGEHVLGYGAPGKGNTLLNYCGIGPDRLPFTVDRNPYKQGKFTPGMHIPIRHPDRLFEARPDYVLILPWNLRDEIVTQLADVRRWGGRFIVPIPAVALLE